MRDIEDQMADLRRQLDNERARGEEQVSSVHPFIQYSRFVNGVHSEGRASLQIFLWL